MADSGRSPEDPDRPRNPGRLTLEASLAEADVLAAKESKVFGAVASAGALVLILAAPSS